MKKLLLTLTVLVCGILGAVAADVTDALTPKNLGFTKQTSYADYSFDKQSKPAAITSDAVYEFKQLFIANLSSVLSLQVNSSKNSVIYVSKSGGTVKSIEIKSTKASFSVYKAASATSTVPTAVANDLLQKVTAAGTVVFTSEQLGDAKAFYIIANGASNITELNVTWDNEGGGDTPDPQPQLGDVVVMQGDNVVSADSHVTMFLGQSLNVSASNAETITVNGVAVADGVYTPAETMTDAPVTVEATMGEESKSFPFYLTVAEAPKPAEGTWALVTDASTLAAGDQVIIVSWDGMAAMKNIKDKSANYVGNIVLSDDKTTLTPADDMMVFALEGEPGKWMFKSTTALVDEQFYIGNTSKTSNDLTFAANPTATEAYQATIDLSESAAATIKFGGTDYAAGMLAYNSASTWFRCYQSKSGGVDKNLKLYRLVPQDKPEAPAMPDAGLVTLTVGTAVDATPLTVGDTEFTKVNHCTVAFEAMHEAEDVDAFVLTFPNGLTHRVPVVEGVATERYSFVETTGQEEVFKVQAAKGDLLSETLEVPVTMPSFATTLTAEVSDLEIEGNVGRLTTEAPYELHATVMVGGDGATFHGMHAISSPTHQQARFEGDAEGDVALFTVTLPEYVTLQVVDAKPVIEGVEFPEVSLEITASYPVAWSSQVEAASAQAGQNSPRRAPAAENLQSRVVVAPAHTAKVQFTATDKVITGIESVVADQADAVYYNLQGVRVAAPERGALYIRVAGNQAAKVRY